MSVCLSDCRDGIDGHYDCAFISVHLTFLSASKILSINVTLWFDVNMTFRSLGDEWISAASDIISLELGGKFIKWHKVNQVANVVNFPLF